MFVCVCAFEGWEEVMGRMRFTDTQTCWNKYRRETGTQREKLWVREREAITQIVSHGWRAPKFPRSTTRGEKEN